MNKSTSNGFTLTEVMVALFILVAAISMAMTGYMFLLKKANLSDIQHELDLDAQTAIERLKNDLRLSSMDEIYGNPENPPYTALSFPIAEIDPDTGRLLRDPNTKKIIWDKTVVYHIVKGTPDKLSKTTFDFDDTADQQQQLNNVVAENYSGLENRTTKIIFENLLNWQLTPEGGQFSCYAESVGYETISLGFAELEPDVNVLEFETTGTRGSDYKLGIDQILVSPSYRYREAELRYPDNVKYSGSTAPTVDPQSSHGNRKQLLYEPDGPGDTLTISFDNDCWDVTDFENLDGGGHSSRDKTVVDVDYALDDIVVKLEGNEISWNASTQGADPAVASYTTNLVGSTVQILLKGFHLDNGNMFSSAGEQCYLTFRAATNSNLKITNVSIGENIASNSTSMAYASGITPTPVTFKSVQVGEAPSGDPITSDPIELPIDPEKNYVITYDILEASAMAYWDDIRAQNSSPITVPTTEITSPSPTGTPVTVKHYVIPALESLTVSYPAEGTYISDIMDTRLTGPTFNYLSWKSLLPGNSSMAFKVRTGDLPDLSDATSFDSISEVPAGTTESSISISGNGRYVQFQAILKADTTDYLETPVLKEVAVDWEGESRMVNVLGRFTKGPDYGDFVLSLNGIPLKAALVVDLEIYQDVSNGMNGETIKKSSAIKAEITPRNSGL